MKSVIREVGSLWHARSHKYIDKIWKNGHWVYIYHDPNQSSGTSQAVQSSASGKKKGKKKAKATKDTTKADQKLRSIVTKLGDKTIDRAEYVRKDKDGRRFMWVRNNEGRLVKKYMDDGKAKHSDQTSDELYHHGIKGQKWGIRRFQNSDGTLTEAGKKRARRDGEGTLNTLEELRRTHLQDAKRYANRAERYSKKADRLAAIGSNNKRAQGKANEALRKGFEHLNVHDYLSSVMNMKIGDLEKNGFVVSTKTKRSLTKYKVKRGDK